MNISNKKQLLLISPRGFCAGVTRAIDVVLEALSKYGAPVYVKHEIVHNKHVIEELKGKGAIFVENIDNVPDDRPLIFSAHGVPAGIVKEARSKREIVVDATCPLVTKVHVQAKKFHDQGFKVILIGHKGHPEVEGTMGQLPTGDILLVETVDDLTTLKFNADDNIAFVTQTTLSIDDTKEIITKLKDKFPHINSSPKEDICYATTNRQNAIKAFAGECDAFIVVGSQNSSNSNRLVEVAKNAGCPKSNLLENANELDVSEYKDNMKIGISSGASVPEILVREVIDKFENSFETSIKSVALGEENVKFKLPPEVRN